jgi:hypothetical protein
VTVPLPGVRDRRDGHRLEHRVGQRVERGRLGAYEPPGQRAGAQLGEADRTAVRRHDLQHRFAVGPRGSDVDADRQVAAEFAAQVAVDRVRQVAVHPDPVPQQHSGRAAAQRGDHRVALELAHPGLRFGVAPHGRGRDPPRPGRDQQPRPAGVGHHDVRGDRRAGALGAARRRVEDVEHLAQVRRAQFGVAGTEVSRCRGDRTHAAEPSDRSTALRHSRAYARNMNASGVTSALYQSIAANVPISAVLPAMPIGPRSRRKRQMP